MTLIQQFAGLDMFIIVATDTRVVDVHYTLDDEIKIPSPKGKDDKAVLITDKVIFSQAGIVSRCEKIFEALKKKLKPFYYLDDCKEVFKTICTKYQEDFKNTFRNEEKRFVVNLTGFKKDGTTGVLTFSSSSGFHESPQLSEDYPIFIEYDSPTKELNEKGRRVFYDLDSVVNEGNPMTTFVNHFAKVHGIISRVEPEFVSSQCIYHFLIKDENGDIKYEQSRTDLSSLIETMPTKEELLEQIRQQTSTQVMTD